MLNETKNLIIGGGLTGLALGNFLESEDYVILEKESTVGGLCRTVSKNGYLFDSTGHLLHLKDSGIRSDILELLPDLNRIERKAFISIFSSLVRYPFQVHLRDLPPEKARECLIEFIREKYRQRNSPENLKDWFKYTFGEGMTRQFFYPYNRKLWCRDLSEMTYEWVSWSVPEPTLKEIVDGTLGISQKDFGYNPAFYYPQNNGIQSLPDAFLQRISSKVKTSRTVEEISPESQKVEMRDGESIGFDRLITTMPLPELLDRIIEPPEDIKKKTEKLKWINVFDINLGLKQKVNTEAHWLYFPEKEYPFYRAGFPTNFCQSLAPEGCSTVYIEISYLPGENIDVESLKEKSINELEGLGFFNGKNIEVENIQFLEPAYVVFDRDRKRNLPDIMDYLNEKNVYSIGRFGSWDYLSMKDCVSQAKNFAGNIKEL